MQAETATIIASVIAVIGPIVAAIVANKSGRRSGAIGKHKGIEGLPTEMDLHGTRWTGEYLAHNREGEEGTYSITAEFKQYGGHVVGEGSGNGRKWMIEGVISHRRLCYVYVDTDPNRFSIGASALCLDPGGKKLEGVWVGWAPSGKRLTPQKLTLNKVAGKR